RSARTLRVPEGGSKLASRSCRPAKPEPGPAGSGDLHAASLSATGKPAGASGDRPSTVGWRARTDFRPARESGSTPTGCLGRVDVVDLEQGHRSRRMASKELVVGIPGRHELNLVALRGGELDGRRLLEVRPQTHHLAQEPGHRDVLIRGDTHPPDVSHLHAAPGTRSVDAGTPDPV